MNILTLKTLKIIKVQNKKQSTSTHIVATLFFIATTAGLPQGPSSFGGALYPAVCRIQREVDLFILLTLTVKQHSNDCY